MLKTFKQRMEALEQARWARLTPLERAYELIERGTSVEEWPDAELNAYRDAAGGHLMCLTDEQVEELAALSSPTEQRRLYEAMTGQPWPDEV